jgi:hypothetical protein
LSVASYQYLGANQAAADDIVVTIVIEIRGDSAMNTWHRA